MNAPAASPTQTANPPEPMLGGILAALAQFGLGMARPLSKLAAVEEAAADAMTEAAVAAARTLVAMPGCPEERRLAAQRADASDVLRDAAAARMATIAAAFDSTSRGIRRTVALARRLEDPRPFRLHTVTENRDAARSRPASGPRDRPPESVDRIQSDLAEEMDPPERFPDETGGRPLLEVVAMIRDDFGLPARDLVADEAKQRRAEQRRAEREAVKAYAFDSPERQARVDEVADRLAWRAPRDGPAPDG